MSFKLVTVLTLWIPNILSIIACIILFACYFRLPKETVSLKMIFTLIVSNFVYHCFKISSEIYPELKKMDFIKYTDKITYQFSLLWVCNMAFFLCRLLKFKRMSNIHLYFYIPLAVLLLLSIASSLIW